mmetsp:Transcript_17011/g.54068  ORF Transcript_17011/g.54068 Transcript_17011/m.54068 type:complete len:398 (-) Transcript_17011:106-1299(-)
MSLFVSTRGGEAAVDDLDLLEQGACREVICESTGSPTARKSSWQQCHIESEDKQRFRLIDDRSGKVLLTARKDKAGDYYISQYEDFPDSFKGPASRKVTQQASDLSDIQDCTNVRQPASARRYCSILRLNKAKPGYTLVSCTCELCDNHLGKLSCGSNLDSEDRQVLAIIHHSMKRIEHTQADARSVQVQLPSLLGPRERVVWCPRTMKGDSDPATNKSAENTQRLRSGSMRAKPGHIPSEDSRRGEDVERKADDSDDDFSCDEGSDAEEEPSWRSQARHRSSKRESGKGAELRRRLSFDSAAAGTDGSLSDRLYFDTKLPYFSEHIGSLVLKFRGGRVLEASSKNFILADRRDSKHMVFQLGKVAEGIFNLDFKHPISPLQAFGIALSAYGFRAKD